MMKIAQIASVIALAGAAVAAPAPAKVGQGMHIPARILTYLLC